MKCQHNLGSSLFVYLVLIPDIHTCFDALQALNVVFKTLSSYYVARAAGLSLERL